MTGDKDVGASDVGLLLGKAVKGETVIGAPDGDLVDDGASVTGCKIVGELDTGLLLGNAVAGFSDIGVPVW